jgi:hypothetical protein
MNNELLIEALEIAVNNFEFDGEMEKVKALEAYIEDTKKEMERTKLWA